MKEVLKEVKTLLKINGYKFEQKENKTNYIRLTFSKVDSLLLDVYFSKKEEIIKFDISDYDTVYFSALSTYEIDNIIETISEI